MSDSMNETTERCGRVLNGALHRLLDTRDDVYILGEDIVDPYGGAFGITRGLSTRWPERVIATPISEASLVGIGGGMALRGLRPIVEIMFGDFLALGFDQILNHIGKYRAMYHGQVDVPLVVRTPMGGRRGYGPTHSQSLEKFLIGVPGIDVVAVSEYHDPAALLISAVECNRPVFLIENKVLYGRVLQTGPSPTGIFERRISSATFPSVTFTPRVSSLPHTTLVAYGGMAHHAIEAAVELAMEHEIFCDVVLPSQLSPMDNEPVVSSVQRTGGLVTIEEGTLTGGVGAELASRVQEAAWESLRGPILRVAAEDTIIPVARGLEERILPGTPDIVMAVLSTTGRCQGHA